MSGTHAHAPARAAGSLLQQVRATSRITRVALGVVALALATVVAADQAVYRPRVDRTIEATRLARLSHEAMLDQQTGLRGFLLSKDAMFLEAYERGESALDPIQRSLTDVVGGDGGAGPLLVDVRVAQQRWLDQWAAEAVTRGATDDVASTSAFLAEDKRLFDGYREAYDRLIDRLSADRTAALDDQATALVAASLTALAVTVVATVLLVRRASMLRRAVDAPVRDVLERLGAIGAGDFTAATAPEDRGAPAEIARIGQGLRETAAALAEARSEAEAHAALLDERSRRQAEVLRFAREVAGSLSLRYVLQGACTHAAAIAEGARALLWLLDEAGQQLTLAADSDRAEVLATDGSAVDLGDGPVGQAAALAEVRHGESEATTLAIPMIVGARVIGVIELRFGSEASTPTDDLSAMLETLAVHAATAIAAARLHEQTAHLAAHDALTGLPNRRQLEADLAREVTASLRYQRPLTVLMIDVDHFKSYNDAYGHQAGDATLQAVAAVLSSGLRATDLAYRYGGEEFALVLRETRADHGAVLAERLRAAVEHRFEAPGERRAVTVSIGVAGLPEHGPTPALLVEAADHALYAAKRAGRNQVAHASASGAEDRREVTAAGD